MEKWEEAVQYDLMTMYNTGEYLELLTRYCHEGLSTRMRGNEVEAYICSHSEKAKTAKEAIKRLAYWVYCEVCNEMLGC